MGGLLRSINVGIKMAIIEMGSHKLRSALSVIGVMLGVASLVAIRTGIGTLVPAARTPLLPGPVPRSLVPHAVETMIRRSSHNIPLS